MLVEVVVVVEWIDLIELNVDSFYDFFFILVFMNKFF
jgi:hypothetical protein